MEGHDLKILELSAQRVHAACSCGVWSLFSFGKDGKTEAELMQEASDGHEGHLQSLRLKERLENKW